MSYERIDERYQLPEEVTISTPYYAPRARGYFSTESLDTSLKIRIKQDDLQFIDQVSDMVDMKRSDFIRECALKVAKELKRDYLMQMHMLKVKARKDKKK